ncbi:UNVERIFIED_CONTAM: hypothetical protein GTU68_016904 [Idotea baltica]|nr:hypothetical protein [Idotea baltica]
MPWLMKLVRIYYNMPIILLIGGRGVLKH